VIEAERQGRTAYHMVENLASGETEVAVSVVAILELAERNCACGHREKTSGAAALLGRFVERYACTSGDSPCCLASAAD
jgi:hypothetical protein